MVPKNKFQFKKPKFQADFYDFYGTVGVLAFEEKVN